MVRGRWDGWRTSAGLALAVLALACTSSDAATTAPDALQATAARVPLSDLNALYPGGNAVPAAHAALGQAQARLVTPRSSSGQPVSATRGGRIVLLGLGYSNMAQEWCTRSGVDGVTCDAWSLMGQVRGSALTRTAPQGLQLFNGARDGGAISSLDSPADPDYARIDALLGAQSLGPAQVQAVALKVANMSPTLSLPAANADANDLARRTGATLRALRIRYPNLRLVFLLSRSYGGYATVPLNPEPYAYEGGIAVQRVIAAQISQEQSGRIDPLVGSLAQAPWVAWGPYLWADGMHPRLDGLTWARNEFESDGTHPSRLGEQKVGALLLGLLLSSPFTACWIRPARVC